MKENISTLENSNSVLSVTLRENRFAKDGTYYATVSRNTASLKNILSEIAEDNAGIEPFMLQYAAILIQKKILKMLSQGKAVNVLDLGTLYIAMKCRVKGKSEVPDSGNFYIKFKPSALADESLSDLNVDKIVFADGSPEVTEIEDIVTGTESVLVAGNPARIKGARLKLSDNSSGILFAPVKEYGKIDADESTWIAVPPENVFRNMPTELNFFVPKAVSPGTWQIVIRTTYLSKGRNRKDAVETVSDVVTVNAA